MSIGFISDLCHYHLDLVRMQLSATRSRGAWSTKESKKALNSQFLSNQKKPSIVNSSHLPVVIFQNLPVGFVLFFDNLATVYHCYLLEKLSDLFRWPLPEVVLLASCPAFLPPSSLSDSLFSTQKPESSL